MSGISDSSLSRPPLGEGGLRGRVWLPGIAAAILIGVLMTVVISASGSRETGRSSAPSQAEITRDMQDTTLVGEPLEHFEPAGLLKTVADGAHGQLTAAVGTSVPTTDGNGQLVFFWHDHHFLGWDGSTDAMEILSLHAVGVGRFRVTYANYAPHDPACCPSRVPVSVVYSWRGDHFALDGTLPAVRPVPARVRFSG
jgi:hypothetical protein